VLPNCGGGVMVTGLEGVYRGGSDRFNFLIKGWGSLGKQLVNRWTSSKKKNKGGRKGVGFGVGTFFLQIALN